MDKNKSVFKLKGLPNSYWLNLDADEHRRIYMEAQFKYWEIENHTRIAGYDGRTDDVCQFLKVGHLITCQRMRLDVVCLI